MSTVPAAVRGRDQAAERGGSLTIVTDRTKLVVPPDVHTLDGLRAWAASGGVPEEVRVAFLGGEVHLDMSNEEINTHAALKTQLIIALGAMVNQEKLGKFYAGGVLLVNEAGGISNNPDAVFLSRGSIETRRVRLVPRKGAEHLYRELEGTPDWVLEVVSDGSVQKDTVFLREAYHRAGNPEYWLADARGEELHFQILTHRKTGYAATPVREGWQRSKVFGRSFRLERRLDEFGLWEYVLHVREG